MECCLCLIKRYEDWLSTIGEEEGRPSVKTMFWCWICCLFYLQQKGEKNMSRCLWGIVHLEMKLSSAVHFQSLLFYSSLLLLLLHNVRVVVGNDFNVFKGFIFSLSCQAGLYLSPLLFVGEMWAGAAKLHPFCLAGDAFEWKWEKAAQICFLIWLNGSRCKGNMWVEAVERGIASTPISNGSLTSGDPNAAAEAKTDSCLGATQRDKLPAGI